MEYNNLIDQVIILDREDLTPTEKLVAVTLLSFRNAENGRCNPPIYSENTDRKTLCTRTSLSRRSVIDTIRKLEDKNIIKTEKKIGKVTGYKFTLTRATNAPVQEAHPCTTCTQPVQEVHPTRAPRAPIPNKEQIRTNNTSCENSSFDDFSLEMSEPEKEETTKVQSQKTLDCPYEEIASIYNEVLGQYLGKCQKLTSTRKKHIRARWNDCIGDKDFDSHQGGLDYFREYFNYIKKSDFLIGKSGNFRASFDWIFVEGNYTKICEGRYKNRPVTNNYQR